MSSPTLPLSDQIDPSENSSNLHVSRKTSALQSAPEPSPDETPLHDTVPNHADAPYDYLEAVKHLADKIDPEMFDNCLGAYLRHDGGLISRWYGLYSQSNDFTLRTSGWSYDMVKSLLPRDTLASKQPPYVLIAHNIDRTQVQTLGTLFNIDPCFFVRHLALHNHAGADLETWGNSFKTFVASENDKHPGLLRMKARVAATSTESTSIDWSALEGPWEKPIRTPVSCSQVTDDLCESSLLWNN